MNSTNIEIHFILCLGFVGRLYFFYFTPFRHRTLFFVAHSSTFALIVSYAAQGFFVTTACFENGSSAIYSIKVSRGWLVMIIPPDFFFFHDWNLIETDEIFLVRKKKAHCCVYLFERRAILLPFISGLTRWSLCVVPKETITPCDEETFILASLDFLAYDFLPNRLCKWRGEYPESSAAL